MSKRKLLLADDSITIQKVVNLTFADEGIEVISVGDGDSAMRKFDEFMPDLVMADVNMPGLNGYEVCRIIKLTEETQDIPVILLVGSFEPFDEAEAKKAGADDFLTKPFQSIRQLVNKVTDLLNRRDRAPEEASADELQNTIPIDYPDEATAGAVAETPGEASFEAPGDTFAETLEFEKPLDSTPSYDESRREEPVTVEVAPVETGGEFGDAGMDDEMIEASGADEYFSDAGVREPEKSIDYGKTSPLNAADLKGFDIVERERELRPESAADQEAAASPRAEAASFEEEARKLGDYTPYEEAENESEVVSGTEPELDYYLPAGERGNAGREEFDKEITDAETLAPEISYENEPPRTPDFAQAPAEESGEAEPAAEETSESAETGTVETAAFGENDQIEETGRIEDPGKIRESAESLNASFEEAEHAQFVEESPAERETFDETDAVREMAKDYNARSEAVDVPEETQAPAVAETVDEMPMSDASAAASAFSNFDDGDLLELPPLVEETGIRPAPTAPPLVPEVVAEKRSEPESKITVTKTIAESEIALTFPPELIEAIAQKVADKLSAKTLNDVSSQIADLVVKKLAEEKKE
ncbi:MAG TPA: response regulator [Pyrinomonadaceae bacterium]